MALMIRQDQPSKRFAGGGDIEVGIKRQILMILGILKSRQNAPIFGDVTYLPLSNYW